nr:MurR/RpiR family transcriptional regulator [uncultured Sellimonas sp.]
MWETELRLCYAMLSRNQKKAADYLLSNPEAAGNMTVREAAKRVGVGQATVIRMLQTAGYESWSAFQKTVWCESGQQEMAGSIHDESYTREMGKRSSEKREHRRYDTVFQIIRDDVDMIADMAKHLDLKKLEEVVKIIKKAKIIDVYGTDNSANAAAELSGRMLHLGLTSRNYSDLFFQKVSAGHLGKKDVAIGFSISGETQAVIDSLAAARQAGAVTVAVTGDEASELAGIADYIFITPTIHFSEISRWISSRIAQIAFVDALCGAILISDPERFNQMLIQSTKEFEQDMHKKG